MYTEVLMCIYGQYVYQASRAQVFAPPPTLLKILGFDSSPCLRINGPPHGCWDRHGRTVNTTEMLFGIASCEIYRDQPNSSVAVPRPG